MISTLARSMYRDSLRAKGRSRMHHPSLVETLLLTRVCDLDEAMRDPKLQEFIEGFQPSYLLVALPKSSSTYCTLALAKILDVEIYKDIVTQDVFTPKDLSIPGIVNARNRRTISQVHLTATGANIRIIRNFRLPFVILLRNMLDVVVSMRDHMNVNPFFSSILIPNDYTKLSETEKLDYIIDTAVPWMITFYTSWMQSYLRGDVECEFFFYEDMVRNPVKFFQDVYARFGRQVSTSNLTNVLTEVEKSFETRFNVGVPGRGSAELSRTQIDKIRRHTRYYPGIDFTLIGL
ncbi:MAG: sulfotransferase domain-containing protein [Candidatus Binatia bacterium]